MSGSPIIWYGGKAKMAKKIINIMPFHKTYVEVFGGAGHVLFSKKRSQMEVYNDIHEGLYALFNVIRDKEKAEKLRELLELTPYSKNEFEYCKDWENEENEVEKARKFFVLCNQSFSGTVHSWKFSVRPKGDMPQTVKSYLSKIHESLPFAIKRLQGVQIDNVSFEKVIERYDSKDTLFYLDPPYVHDTRSESATDTYDFEMDNEMHKNLVEVLLNLKGKAIVSGYDHSIYDSISEGKWKKIPLGKFSKGASKVESGEKREKGEEMLWINYKIGED